MKQQPDHSRSPFLAFTVCLSLLSHDSLAASSKPGMNLNFTGKISAPPQKLRGPVCVVRAKKPGRLAANAAHSTLSTLNPGGKSASLRVTSGDIRVNVYASGEQLFLNGQRLQTRFLYLASGLYIKGHPELGTVESVNSIKSRIYEHLLTNRYAAGFVSEKTKLEKRKRIAVPPNKTTPYKVWFDSMQYGGGTGRFAPGSYVGRTTITCQPM